MNGRRFCIFVVIIVLYMCASILLVWDAIEQRKLDNFEEYECYLKDISIIEGTEMIYFHWNVTALDKNQILGDVTITAVVTPTSQSVVIEMNKFKINQTYLCYGPSDKESILRGFWQWNKPLKTKEYRLLLIANMLLIPAILLQVFGRCYYQESMNSHQHQLTSIVANRNGQFSTVFSEVPPPTYDEAMRGLVTQQTII